MNPCRPLGRAAASRPPRLHANRRGRRGTKKTKVVVAVLEFAAAQDDLKELAGSLLGPVEPALGEAQGIRLVTRTDLEKIQEEQSLDLAGLVAQGEGAQVGPSAAGARTLWSARGAGTARGPVARGPSGVPTHEPSRTDLALRPIVTKLAPSS